MRYIHHSILLLICLTVLVQNSYPCICVQAKLKDEIKRTDFIFVGEVTDIIEDKSYVPVIFKADSPALQESLDKIAATRKRFFIKFRVKKNFKGVKDKEITLIQYRSESPCPGIYFDKSKKYLVFAYKNETDNEINDRGICSRSQVFDKDSEDYKELIRLEKQR